MGSAPFFSIIVPVYKTEKYIHQCVESLLCQSFTDFEVVLVDDGSPDSCPKICDDYAKRDSRIRVVHKENGGLVSARKAGLHECRGEYILNVDSDDYIGENLLEKIYEIIKGHNPQVVMLGYNQFDEKTVTEFKTRLPEGLYSGDGLGIIRDNLILGKDLSTVIYNCVWSMAFKKELYEPHQSAVPNEISRGEDLAVTAPLLAAAQTVYVSGHCGYFYRNNPTSIMNVFKKDEISRIKVLINFLSKQLSNDYSARLNAYFLLEYYRFLSSAIAVCDYKEYRKLIEETLDSEFAKRLKNAHPGKAAHISDKLVFAVLRHRLFRFFWLLKRVKKGT